VKKIYKSLWGLFLIPTLLLAQNEINDAYFNYLQQIYFENNSGDYNSFLRNELNQYLQIIPNTSQQQQILNMLAHVEFSGNHYPQAFLNYVKIVFFYPQSKTAEQAKTILSKLFNRFPNIQFAMLRDTIFSVLQNRTPSASIQEAWFEFISFIYGLQADTLNALLIKDIQKFRVHYGLQFKNDDVLLFWCGHLAERIKEPTAALGFYRELLALHPQSVWRNKTLLRLGQVAEICPGHLQEAKDYLLEVINAEAGGSEAATAQFTLAALYADSLHQQTEALANFKLFVETYPEHPLKKTALQRLGALAVHLKKWPEAAEARQQFYEAFPDDSSAVTVLENLTRIYLEHLKDYERGAQTLLLYGARFNNPQKMYLAAQIYANRLKDKRQAKVVCRKLIKAFPKSEFAQKAKKLLKSLP